MDINKKTLSQQIYDTLRADILTGRIELGERLVNAALQERFGVSAIPIRDAIIRLEQAGMIDDINKSGARVVTLDLETALDINEIAGLICTSALRQAFDRADRAAVSEKLCEAIERQRAHVEDDEYFDRDYDFHIAFIEYSGNSQYKRVYHQYSIMLEILARYAACADAAGIIRGRASCIRTHEEIADAFSQGKGKAAERAMYEHYRQGQDGLVRYFDEVKAKTPKL